MPQQLPGVGVDAAVVPVFFRHAAEVGAYHHHDDAGQENGNHSACRAPGRQEHVAGHDEGSPAHGAYHAEIVFASFFFS